MAEFWDSLRSALPAIAAAFRADPSAVVPALARIDQLRIGIEGGSIEHPERSLINLLWQWPQTKFLFNSPIPEAVRGNPGDFLPPGEVVKLIKVIENTLKQLNPPSREDEAFALIQRNEVEEVQKAGR